MSGAAAMSNPFDAALSNEQLIAFVADAETREIVTSTVASKWPSALVYDGGLTAALGSLSQEPAPPLVIVDVTGIDDPMAGLRSLMTLCDPSTRIILIGEMNDITLYRSLVQAGARDYLVKPIMPDALMDALEGASKPVSEVSEQKKKVKVIACVGARGGVGASTVAVNVAWLMAHELEKTVALVDLDLQFGTVALALDLEPSTGLREAFENPDRIDGLFIASAMVHESERLFVLSAEEPLEDMVTINPGAFELLISSLPDDFDYVVVDMPQKLAVAQKRLFASADSVVLVSDLSLAGMRDTVRFGQLIRESAPNANLTVIANKVGSAKKGELPKKEFQRNTEMPVKHFVPHEPSVAAAAANAGKPFPVIAKSSPIVKDLRNLAKALSGAGSPAAGKGGDAGGKDGSQAKGKGKSKLKALLGKS